jgi:alkylhydroperoxidase/carboxymuconolactone decarboxylase family protein YurZ
MTNHYHDENDLKLLRDMKALAPTEFQAWAALDGIVGREDRKIPRKYRELIAVAVASAVQRRGGTWHARNEVLRSGLINGKPRRVGSCPARLSRWLVGYWA